MLKQSVCLVLTCGLLAHTSRAGAADPPTLTQCAEAFENAQTLSKKGQSMAALDQLVVCAQPNCPAFLTRECTATYERLKLALPTITLLARRGEMEPLVDVSVSVDGKPLTDRINGLGIPLDPGLHEFRFEHAGDKAVTVNVLLSEGEKNKPVVAEFPVPTPPPPPPRPAPVKKRTAPQSFRVPVPTYLLGGVALIGVGAGIGFRASGAADYNSLADSCGHACAHSDVDAAKQKYLLSHVSFGIGATALVAAGLFLYFGQPKDSSMSQGSVRPLAAGAMLLSGDTPGAALSGSF